MSLKVKIPFVEFESKVPVVSLRIGDRDIYALLDTGSESTLIDEILLNVAKSRKLKKALSFTGINGETEKKQVVVITDNFLLSTGQEIHLAGIASDLSAISTHFKSAYNSAVVISAVLGCDFLETYDVKIDFEEHVIELYL